MDEKVISKHLTNLENYFSPANPVLQKAGKTFHELDQLEYDLGLIDENETTAKKSSWWPIVSFIGGNSPAKSQFINRFLGTSIHSSDHKYSVHQFTPQDTSATLPATALDADHKLPFYQISKKIEQTLPGEGRNINAYLELKTVNSEKLRGKLFVTTPVVGATQSNAVHPILTQHILDISDLALVFTDLFDAQPDLIKNTVDKIIALQDSNKFIFVIDHSTIELDTNQSNEIIAAWQSRLADLGIYTGQFIVLTNKSSSAADIEHRLDNIENDRSYRVINTLEKGIRDISDVYIPEVENHIKLWKDRVNMSTLIILGFVVILFLFAEISMGVTDLLLDPIIGPAILLILIAVLLPTHLIMAKVHAKFIMTKLEERQKKLNLSENLVGLFEQSLTFWRMTLPINEPVGKNKKTKKRINDLIEKSRDLVQELNDQFSVYDGAYEKFNPSNFIKN